MPLSSAVGADQEKRKRCSAAQRLLVGLAMGTLAACSVLDQRDFSKLTTTPASVRFGAIVRLTARCPSEPSPASDNRLGVTAAGLMGVLASAGAQFAVNAIEEAIKDYEDGLNGFFTATTPSNKADFQNAGCLIIARGLIGDTQVPSTQKSGMLDGADLSELGLADFPAFYLETRIVSAASGTTLTPIYLSYPAATARTRGSGKKYVTVAIALSAVAVKPATKPDSSLSPDQAFAIAFHDFGRLEIGKHYQASTLNGTESFLPAITQPEFVVNVVVTESEEPSVALRAAQSAFASNKDALKTEFEKIFKRAMGVKQGQ